jgi:hypothetical protein
MFEVRMRSDATATADVISRSGGFARLRSALRASVVRIAVSALLGGLPAAVAEGATDAAVNEHVVRLKQILMDSQSPDGSWEYGGKDQNLGLTALAILALKYAGVPNDHAVVNKGVGYILNNKSRYVYAEGLIPCALELVNHKACRNRIRHSFRYLMEVQNAGGNWGYVGGRNYYDNSNSQFAVLGLAAAKRCGFPDTRADLLRFRKVQAQAIRHWKNAQTETGGWAYRAGKNAKANLAMTCAGIASLHLLDVHLEQPGEKCGEYKYDRNMQKALACLADVLSTSGVRSKGYSLYALERVGVFLDLRTIGEHDWYREGASAILARPARQASRSGLVEIAFQLLFLVKGNAPVAIAKWRWSGDWNNDHGDARAWVAWSGGELGKRFDWWECRLDAPGSPAATASLVFVNGHGRFQASDAELDFLRRFLLCKGTVVAEACCGRKEFLESFKKVMCEKLFPGQLARFTPIRADHRVCSVVHDLKPAEVGALEFSVACRKPRMLLLSRDISCALNDEKGKSKPRRASSGKSPAATRELDRARKVATNLLAWALTTRKPGGKLTRKSIEAETDEFLTADQLARESGKRGRKSRFAMGRLVHRGDWHVDEKFFPALRAALADQKAVPCFERELPIVPTSEDLFHVPFVFMTGHEDPALKPTEYLHLRTYLQNGGFVFVSACCGSKHFDLGARDLIGRILPNDKLERIPPDDPLWKSPFDCRGKPEGTSAFRKRFGEAWAPLHGVRREGRWVLVYSPVDLCCDLQGDLADYAPAYRAASSVKLIGNIINCALSP